MIALALATTACAGAGEETPEAATQEPAAAETVAPPACEPEGTELTLTALHAEAGELPAFDRECIAVPAGEPFTIELVNEDFLEHNVSIYREDGDAYSDGLFNGERFRGPDETMVYEVPAIEEPGEYSFRCDVHMTVMKGVLVVA